MKPAGYALRRISSATLCLLWLLSAMPTARADGLANASRAYARNDYVRAAHDLSSLAQRGNARAQGILGFMYENGFGVPQAYDAAADLYARAADQGDPFAQAMLGLMFDKGHGVPQSFVLAYKWLNLAAAHAPKRDRDYYLRLRNAVASKMNSYQVVEGQRLASSWAPGRW